ncbi:MAG: CDP-diacylglycerol--glycerol-3-phosphate 3-phosphatidyltransferase [Gammaproteobacteria bacterium]|nr:CDP-diacylglycerol--glycerol-3-phosphate 3-phosphatidyltransferase [Gammaproteobacteria bacterium]
MNLPTKLTLLRIALIPAFVVIFYLPSTASRIIAGVIFIIAALTDLLDGYLARRLGQTTRLGAFLDPVADKLIVAVALVLLLQQDPRVLLALPVAVIIGREITVSALREWMAELGVRSHVQVSIWGKIKTTAQMLALIFMIIRIDLGPIDSYRIGVVLLYLAALLTIWSMCQYLAAAWPDLRRGRS